MVFEPVSLELNGSTLTTATVQPILRTLVEGGIKQFQPLVNQRQLENTIFCHSLLSVPKPFQCFHSFLSFNLLS